MPTNTTLSIPRRRLGRTELSIPVVPFGTQGFGNHFGFVSDGDAVTLIKHAVGIGVNHFDCARCYGDSMRKLGLALKEIPRGDVIITGRLCCHSAAEWGGYGEGTPDYSTDRVIADVEDQLELLGTDYFDGMLIHDPPQIEPTLEKGGTLDGVLQCKARGLVRYVGYGMRPHDFHVKAIATGDVDLILCFNDYNLARQTVTDDILPAAAEADVGVMNGWSILRGMLTGVDIDAEVAKGRWKNHPDVEPAREIWKWCQAEGIDLLQLALQFCLREERIHGNNIGSLNIEQLEANVRAASTSLSDEVWEKYDSRFGGGTTS
ncbi:MAG: aldo/keto reductase [Candidatus Poribacteria bacterium]|nr:aldo/keto reductase [Candidatus Poribacteria bacterium]